MHRYARPGSDEAQWNTTMSKVREVVEWGFNDIPTQWSWLDCKRAMKMLLSPIGKYYLVGAFLNNIRNTFYGKQTMIYLSRDLSERGKMSLQDYLNLIENNE